MARASASESFDAPRSARQRALRSSLPRSMGAILSLLGFLFVLLGVIAVLGGRIARIAAALVAGALIVVFGGGWLWLYLLGEGS